MKSIHRLEYKKYILLLFLLIYWVSHFSHLCIWNVDQISNLFALFQKSKCPNVFLHKNKFAITKWLFYQDRYCDSFILVSEEMFFLSFYLHSYFHFLIEWPFYSYRTSKLFIILDSWTVHQPCVSLDLY
jgi:hypothetical protein